MLKNPLNIRMSCRTLLFRKRRHLTRIESWHLAVALSVALFSSNSAYCDTYTINEFTAYFEVIDGYAIGDGTQYLQIGNADPNEPGGLPTNISLSITDSLFNASKEIGKRLTLFRLHVANNISSGLPSAKFNVVSRGRLSYQNAEGVTYSSQDFIYTFPFAYVTTANNVGLVPDRFRHELLGQEFQVPERLIGTIALDLDFPIPPPIVVQDPGVTEAAYTALTSNDFETGLNPAYAVDHRGTNQLLLGYSSSEHSMQLIDQQSGDLSRFGYVAGFEVDLQRLNAFAVRPSDAKAFAWAGLSAGRTRLVSLDYFTGTAKVVNQSQLERSVSAAAFGASNELFAFFEGGEVGIVDTSTGSVRPAGNVGISLRDVAFASDGTWYGLHGSNEIYRLDIASGGATKLFTLPAIDFRSIEFDASGSLFSAANIVGIPAIFEIDLQSGQLLDSITLTRSISELAFVMPIQVPEPATWLLASLGLACGQLARRQRTA